jgi:phospholipid/cholesterol/gamma-HCH transport system ATP-binding protein
MNYFGVHVLNWSDCMCQPLIEIKNLNFQRANQVIFKDLSLTIRQGQVTAIMGPSGIGKTTLLKLIGAQLKPQSGQVFFDGVEMHKANKKTLYALRCRMGMLFQSGALFTDMNVIENVAFPLKQHTDLPAVIIRRMALMKLEAVGLRGAAHYMPSQLSGGMQRRAALARAIALEPDVILFDEPFTGQDPIAMAVLMKLIYELTQVLKITSVVVSHDVGEVMQIADFTYVIAHNGLIGSGTPMALKTSKSEILQQFLAGRVDGPVPFHMPAPDYQEDLFL